MIDERTLLLCSRQTGVFINSVACASSSILIDLVTGKPRTPSDVIVLFQGLGGSPITGSMCTAYLEFILQTVL